MSCSRRTSIGILSFLVLSTLSTASLAQVPPKAESAKRSGLEEMLLAAAEERGIGIDSSSTLTLVNGKTSLVTAPVADFAQVPATELPKGVNAAFAYFSERSGLAAGFYTLRVSAPDIRLGTIDGTVEFINGDGNVVAERRATIQVHSLTVPPGLAPRVQIVNSTVLGEFGGKDVQARQVWILCSNGQWICFDDFEESSESF
jgi:hypothetical protein